MPFSDDLFLCEACEAGDAALGLMRSSGKHVEDHRLIRCLARTQDDEITVSMEQRLVTLEDRLNSMHGRMETMEQLLRQLTEAVRLPTDVSTSSTDEFV